MNNNALTSGFDSDKKKLLKSMEAFSHTARVPVTLVDENLDVKWECLGERKFCSTFSAHDNCNKECKSSIRRAVETAKGMDEPYVFLCASELVMIIYYVEDGSRDSTILVGPVVVGKNRDSVTKKLFRTMPDFREYVNEVLELVDLNVIRSSSEMSCIYEVFCDCIFSHRLMRAEKVSDDSILCSLKQSIKRGDKDCAAANFTLLYNRAYMSSAGSVNRTKHYISNSLEGIITDPYFSSKGWNKEIAFVEDIKNASSEREVYDVAKKIVEVMAEMRFSPSRYAGNSLVVKAAINYLMENYDDSVDLTKTAEVVHVNPSYLSSLFRKETGQSFSANVNAIRLENSAKLLRESDKTIDDIAKICGFSSRSYYIRRFKKYYGETPGKYRKG